MSYGVYVAQYTQFWMATGTICVQYSYMQMQGKNHPLIPKISDKQDIQVEASIKAKGQMYCYLSITWLLSRSEPFGNYL